MFIIAPMIRIIVIVGLIGAIVLIAIHFGINPVSGGIPLKDSRIIGIINCDMGEMLISLFRFLVFVRFFTYIMINKGVIIIEYIAK